MPLSIPSQFQLFGRTITVTEAPHLMGAEDVYGKSSYRDGTIRLQAPTEGLHDVVQSEQTFCHELVHWILNVMSEKELCNNEQFVDTFGQLLHQALTTGVYLQSDPPPAPPADPVSESLPAEPPMLDYVDNPLGVRLGAHTQTALLPLMALQGVLRPHGWLVTWKKIDQDVAVTHGGSNGTMQAAGSERA